MRQEPSNAYVLKRLEQLEANLDSEAGALADRVLDVEMDLTKALEEEAENRDEADDERFGQVDLLKGQLAEAVKINCELQAKVAALFELLNHLEARLSNVEKF